MPRPRTGRSICAWALSLLFGCTASPSPDGVSERAQQTARYAWSEYQDDIEETLARLIRFQTVHQSGVANAANPEFVQMTEYLRGKAEELGLDFEDHGAVVVIGLGSSREKLGLITHGDVQPADPSKWPKSPFELDRESEPGKLIGRGTEDDKGPIAIALYAMKALADQRLPQSRRVELIVSYTEESDWAPMNRFLEGYAAPQLNIALDSKYPVVTAEKGWCLVQLALPLEPFDARGPDPVLASFTGGSFVSQVPEDSVAVVRGGDAAWRARLEEAAAADADVQYRFEEGPAGLRISATGKSAHSSEPEAGVNAITRLARVLGEAGVSGGAPAHFVEFINRYVGNGHYAEQFGRVAFSHPFMGPLTMALTTLQQQDGKLVLSLNLRRPAGKSTTRLEEEIRSVVQQFQQERQLDDLHSTLYLGEPHLVEDAPHVPVLLRVFAHYTGAENPQALAAGGGTHARLFPNGVSFGPHMPHRPYTGHTEREYLTREELELDVLMVSAMLVELAASSSR